MVSPNDADDTHLRVTCFTRPASFESPIDATLRMLDRLQADAVIDDVAVETWPREVALGEGAPYSEVVSRFEEFTAWADKRNVYIQPPFSTQSRRSEITGETREVLVTPVRCLAVFVDGALRVVFPHTARREDAVETYTVRDALALLEERATQAFVPTPTTDSPPGDRWATGQSPVEPP